MSETLEPPPQQPPAPPVTPAPEPVKTEGWLELNPDGSGHLRRPVNNYLPTPSDVFVPAGLIQRSFLRPGDLVVGLLAPGENAPASQPIGAGSQGAANLPDFRQQGGGGGGRRRRRRGRGGQGGGGGPNGGHPGGGGAPRARGPALAQVLSINGLDPKGAEARERFENLSSVYPDTALKLATATPRAGVPGETNTDMSMRVVDLMTPLGKGQRALIVAPARAGKTVLMQNIAHGVVSNNPDVTLFVLLVGERPEEVVDMKRNKQGEVIWSTFDAPAEQHVRMSDLVLERSKRLVEMGKHVVILLDSITRLARANNDAQKGSGRTLSGGVDSRALERPKRFFGAARRVEGAGSLTIIATALIDTGSRMDEVIFEEFKGTGNCEILLDRALMEKRVFPCIDINKSGTRKEELLVKPEDLDKIHALRRALSSAPPVDAMVKLLQKLKPTVSNEEFLQKIVM
jgi:transcription termination factor Rho